MQGKIYLSYGMEFADYDIALARSKYLRNEFQKLGYETFNPFTDEDVIKEALGIFVPSDLPRLKKENLSRFMEVMSDIRQADIHQLHYSDAVVAYLDRSSGGGVSGELTVASMINLPVYSIVNYEEIQQISGWTLSCSTEVFTTPEKCIDFVRNNPII